MFADGRMCGSTHEKRHLFCFGLCLDLVSFGVVVVMEKHAVTLGWRFIQRYVLNLNHSSSHS